MNRDQALTATLDELRDALAEMDGWKFDPPEPCVPGGWWRWNAHPTLKSRTWCKSHPHPPTLDGADSAMPEGYEWERTPFEWLAWKHGSRVDGPAAKVDDTGDKIADLYALGLACRKAMEVNNGK